MNYIITTDCQRGGTILDCSLASLATRLENGGHKVSKIEIETDSDRFNNAGNFNWCKTEEPPVPQWIYTLNVAGVTGEQRLTAGSFREAAQRWNCKVNYAAPFVAQCTTSDGKRATISWNLDPVE